MRRSAALRAFFGSGWAIVATFAAMCVLAVIVASHARPASEATRLRNALLIQPGQDADFDWTPDNVPRDFRLDREVAPEFAAIVGELGLASLQTDWARALALSEQLTSSASSGGAIQSDLRDTYDKIRNGKGYCSDFTAVYLALAKASGLFAREWAFSFDGYGGHGHAFVEVFDRDRRKWNFIDVFNNFYVIDALTAEPLSALEFRAFLAGRHPSGVKIVRAGAGRFGFPSEKGLFEYYDAGVHQWYLWWGNAVFAYDSALPVRIFGSVSRALEQLSAIAFGVHPGFRPVPEPENLPLRDRMFRLRTKLLGIAAAEVLLGVLLVWQVVAWRSARRQSRSGVSR